MRYSFDRLPDRSHTESFKWRSYPEDVLPMFVADMDFVSPEPVRRAIHEIVEAGVFGYPRGLHGDANELPEYAQLIVERLAARHRWSIQPQDVLFLPGVVVSLNVVGHIFRQSGGAVLMQLPVYPPFLEVPGNAGLARQEAELVRQPDGTYTVDWDRFAAALTPNTRVFFLCNPHNPVGRVSS